jgi:hypothetical protein
MNDILAKVRIFFSSVLKRMMGSKRDGASSGVDVVEVVVLAEVRAAWWWMEGA